MQPNYRIGAPVMVVPMTNRWHRNFMPMTPNEEVPVLTRWFDGSSVNFQEQRPELASREIDTAPVPVKPRVLNPADFLKGGNVIV